MKIKTNPYLLWGKRILIYVLGLYLTAMGVVFSARSALGVSPVSSLGNVLFQIGRDAGAPAVVNLGNCTTAVFCLYLLVELLILRRDFKAEMLLQIVVSLLFGQLVNLNHLLKVAQSALNLAGDIAAQGVRDFQALSANRQIHKAFSPLEFLLKGGAHACRKTAGSAPPPVWHTTRAPQRHYALPERCWQEGAQVP